jgi:hypothetical protein
MFRETLVNRSNLRITPTTIDELEDEVQKFVTDIQHSTWEATSLLTNSIKGNTYPHKVRELQKIAKKNAKSGKGGK